ncbi:MAG: hypothetical protein SynsKO_13100 [Synoicihabitans sp.]
MKKQNALKVGFVAFGVFVASVVATAQPGPGPVAPGLPGAVPPGLTEAELDALVEQIRNNPDQLDNLIAAAINRDPAAAPAIVQRLIQEFPTNIQSVTVATLTAVQNSPAPATTKQTITGATALSAATAARDTQAEFADQQVAVASVSAAVQQVIPSTSQSELLTTVQSVLTPPTSQETDTPVVTDQNNQDEDIDGSEQSPDQTTPTTL